MIFDTKDGTCLVCGWPVRYGSRHNRCGAAVEAAIREAVEAEREACAKVCDINAVCYHEDKRWEAEYGAKDCAVSIRARGAA